MKKDRTKIHLLYILERTSILQKRFSCAEAKESFLNDIVIQQGVMHLLQTIAESASLLPDTMKADYPEIEWHAIKGLRNILVHEYLGTIDVETIWQTVQFHVPILNKTVTALLEKYYDN